MPCIGIKPAPALDAVLCWSVLLQGLCTYTAVGVDAAGLVNADVVVAAITPNTVLVTVMHSNNEVKAGAAGLAAGARFPCAQTWARLPISAATHAVAVFCWQVVRCLRFECPGLVVEASSRLHPPMLQ